MKYGGVPTLGLCHGVQRRWLPQYRRQVPRERKRLAGDKPLGTRRTAGAARVQPKTVAQMRRDQASARRNAAAADKAGMTTGTGGRGRS